MQPHELFTAPQVAKICATDLKTIHNWVNRGAIKSFRTPGRHLRFRREDVVEFLEKFGYPVPDDLGPSRRLLVVIDTDVNNLRGVKRSLARDYEVEGFQDPLDAMISIGRRPPQLVLVNGDAGQEMLRVVERLVANLDGTPVAVYGTRPQLARQAEGAGAREFVPVANGKEIRARIGSLLAR